MKYMVKSVEVDVIFYDGGNISEVKKFCPGLAKSTTYVTTSSILIPVKDGSDKYTQPRSYIVKDADGEFSVFSGDEFRESFETVDEHNKLKKALSYDKSKDVLLQNVEKEIEKLFPYNHKAFVVRRNGGNINSGIEISMSFHSLKPMVCMESVKEDLQLMAQEIRNFVCDKTDSIMKG